MRGAILEARGLAHKLLYLKDARKIQMYVERDTGHRLDISYIERRLIENGQRCGYRTLNNNTNRQIMPDDAESRSRAAARQGSQALAAKLANYSGSAA